MKTLRYGRWQAVLGATISIIWCTSALTAERSVSTGDLDRLVMQIVMQIRGDRDWNERAKFAQSLALTLNTSTTPISSSSVDAIASLLGDREDAVRDWAAIALLHAGPEAGRALPQLRSALQNVDAVEGQLTVKHEQSSRSSICMALAVIGGPGAQPSQCRTFPF